MQCWQLPLRAILFAHNHTMHTHVSAASSLMYIDMTRCSDTWLHATENVRHDSTVTEFLDICMQRGRSNKSLAKERHTFGHMLDRLDLVVEISDNDS
jgi:hypothetical protein